MIPFRTTCAVSNLRPGGVLQCFAACAVIAWLAGATSACSLLIDPDLSELIPPDAAPTPDGSLANDVPTTRRPDVVAGDAVGPGDGTNVHTIAQDGSPVDAPAAPSEDGDTSTTPDVADAALSQDATAVHDDALAAVDSATCGAQSASGTLVLFDFTMLTGSEQSVVPMSLMSGATATTLARSAALVPAAGDGSLNARGWATTNTLDTTEYFTFTVVPAAGCKISLTSLSLSAHASDTGPTMAAIATSSDGFAMVAPFVPNGRSDVALTVSPATGAVEVRIYGYGAGGAAGTMRLDDTLSVVGSVE